MDLPAEYRVLFLQGGGNLQFSMVPINFLGREASADYVLTGHWGRKAVQEARREGDALVPFEEGSLRWRGPGELRALLWTSADFDPETREVHFAQVPAGRIEVVDESVQPPRVIEAHVEAGGTTTVELPDGSTPTVLTEPGQEARIRMITEAVEEEDAESGDE